MTALDIYAKLEAEARYFDGQHPEGRSVILNFGERSLTISDFDELPLAHWPLASLSRVGTATPDRIEIAPDQRSAERVILEDSVMIEALHAVCPDLLETRETLAPPRRRRGGLWILALLVVLIGGGVAGLSVFSGNLLALVPPERDRIVGEALAAEVDRALAPGTGRSVRICAEPEGLAALRRMAARLASSEPAPQPVVVAVPDLEVPMALALPGGRVMLSHGLISAAGSPEEVAGVLAHQMGHIRHRDPMREVLEVIGLPGFVSVMLGDPASAPGLDEAARAMLAGHHAPEIELLADAEAHALLAGAGLPTLPLVQGMALVDTAAESAVSGPVHADPGDRAARAAEADRVGNAPFDPVLDDRGWLALQNICEE